MTYGFYKHSLHFKIPGGTSRGILRSKDSWIVYARKGKQIHGLGECSIIKGLSPDPEQGIETLLSNALRDVDIQSWADGEFDEEFTGYPAVRFALETMARGIENGNPFEVIEPKILDQVRSIPINGLIWMGNKESMLRQVNEKIEAGYRCIKIKIGAIDFEEECSILTYIRKVYGPEEIEIRVDANGAFAPGQAIEKLQRISEFEVHSIEQPIQSGQWKEMARLCKTTPVPIALDEELIGVEDDGQKAKMLDVIQPQYIILKPSLLGGLKASSQWIKLANEREIGWWVTSALESNIGLNAIAQWCGTLHPVLPQGLGTGKLFTNNIESPLEIVEGHLIWSEKKNWKIPEDLFKTTSSESHI